MPQLESPSLELNVDVVLKAQGAEPDIIRARRPALIEDAERALAVAHPLLMPRVLYETYRVAEVRHSFLTLEDGTRLRGAFLVEHLAAASEIVVAVVTVGDVIERHTTRMFASDPVMALALDGVGTAAVEALSVSTARHFEELAGAQGWGVSVPLSPGMEGWSLEAGQPQIFSLINAEAIGVTLSESCLMQPGKSLSLIIGMGPHVETQGTICDYCAVRATCRFKGQHAA